MVTRHKVHVGRNVFLIREIKGIKQEALASELGITQQAVSKLEQSEQIDDEKLSRIAKVLGVSPDVLKNFNEEVIFSNISCNFNDNAIAFNTVYQFNPIDKLIDSLEDKQRLYERLLEEKDQMLKMKDDIIKQKEQVIEMYQKQLKAS